MTAPGVAFRIHPIPANVLDQVRACGVDSRNVLYGCYMFTIALPTGATPGTEAAMRATPSPALELTFRTSRDPYT